MTVRVKTRLAFAEGIVLDFDKEQDWFQVEVGGLIVEAIEGHLIVRHPSIPVNMSPIMKLKLP